MIRKGGIDATNEFGARAVYGSELFGDLMYYSSYNDDGSCRCRKDLKQQYKIGWTTGDKIKVVLNLNRCNIQFYLNGKKVRKTLSLQRGKRYYPIVAFSGNTRYELITNH